VLTGFLDRLRLLAVLAAMTGLAVPVATNSLVLNQLDIPPSGLIEMPA
jgi:hypothetical protein